MTAHAAIAAVPKAGTPNRTLLQAMLVSRFAYIIGAGEDPEAFDPRGEGDSPVVQVIGYNGSWFWYDEDDATTGHDGVTCIRPTMVGWCYKVTGIDLLITSVISKTLTTPPDPDDVDEELRPSNGDAYIVPSASTGPWATWAKSIAVWVEARMEWFRIQPKAGWFVSIPGDTRDTVYRYDSVQSDWIVGDGSTAAANTIPLRAIIGTAGSLTIRVQNQTTYAPPGSRQTGGTPTMPLGGTASNINDNDDATTAITSALGDKSAATFADRIVGSINYPAPVDLISIEARGVLGSAVSSSNAMGIWYKSGGVWSQAGSGFTLSATAQNVQRNGSFVAVTDIALVTEAKNWSTATNTLVGLNGFDATVTGTVGDAFIVASPAIGILAGHELKVAICEATDQYTIYAPSPLDAVGDISLGYNIVWRDTAWVSSVGVWVHFDKAGSSLISSVTGSGNYTYNSSTPPTTSQGRLIDTSTLKRKSLRAGAQLRLHYEYEFTANVTNVPTLAVFRRIVGGSYESNAVDWVPFRVDSTQRDYAKTLFLTAPDNSNEYEYQIAVVQPEGATYSLQYTRFTLEEAA